MYAVKWFWYRIEMKSRKQFGMRLNEEKENLKTRVLKTSDFITLIN